jgi:hypothetical protein
LNPQPQEKDDLKSRLFIWQIVCAYGISGFLGDLVDVEGGEVDVHLEQVVLNTARCNNDRTVWRIETKYVNLLYYVQRK